MSESPTIEEIDEWCPHFIEPEGCINCSPKYQGKDVRDGFCPRCNRGVDPPAISTWHVVNPDGTSECCACGHGHPYLPSHLEASRV